jgi:hypothetical protein
MGLGWIINHDSLVRMIHQQIEVRDAAIDEWHKDEMRYRKVEAFLERLGYEVQTTEAGEVKIVKSGDPGPN